MSQPQIKQLIQILAEIQDGPSKCATVLRKHGLSELQFLRACQSAGGIDLIEAKRLMVRSFAGERRQASTMQDQE